MEWYDVKLYDKKTETVNEHRFSVLRGRDLLDAIANKYPGTVILTLRASSSCRGCREELLNQQGHMEPGGCLYRCDK